MNPSPQSPSKLLLSTILVLATICAHTQVTFTSSNLPIIVINTNSQTIVDNPKIMVDMGVIYNGVGVRNYMTDPYNNYNGKAGVELRGSSSQLYHPKKSYAIELWDAAGLPKDTALLGMPHETDWCLIANYIDKSLINNSLTYNTWEEMGWWGPRHKEVELVINGNYMGEFLLVEKIKRDSARVHISKLQAIDTTGDQLTGGYILKIDQNTGSVDYGWNSAYDACGANGAGVYPYIAVAYPDGNSIVNAQKQYIKLYVDSFENALITDQFDPVTGWQHFADLNSFVDYFLIQEFSRNVDGYRASTYFYKDRHSKGGKLTMGIVWDYDRGWGNASYAYGNLPAGWDWPFGDNYAIANPLQVPRWWQHLLADTSFTKALRCRWEQLKNTTLSVSHLHAYCDSMATYLNESQQRNFTQWPILGVQIFPNPTPVPTTYAGEITELKNWITNRWAWLDANIPGTAVNCNFVGIHEELKSNSAFSVYPDPANDILNLYWENPVSGNVMISVVDISGREIFAQEVLSSAEQTIPINVAELPQGIYFVRVESADEEWVQRFVKE